MARFRRIFSIFSVGVLVQFMGASLLARPVSESSESGIRPEDHDFCSSEDEMYMFRTPDVDLSEDSGLEIFVQGSSAPWLEPDDSIAPIVIPPEWFPKKDQGSEKDNEYINRRFKDLYEKLKAACTEANPGHVDECIAESLGNNLDADHDGKVSRKELSAFLKRLLGWSDLYSSGLGDYIFDGDKCYNIPKFNTDGDPSSLSPDELQRLLDWLKKRIGVPVASMSFTSLVDRIQ